MTKQWKILLTAFAVLLGGGFLVYSAVANTRHYFPVDELLASDLTPWEHKSLQVSGHVQAGSIVDRPSGNERDVSFVGTMALLSAYGLAAGNVAAGIAGNARRSRRLVSSSVYGLYAFGALVGIASAMMIYGFVTPDFSIKYVAKTSDVNMATWYKV